MKKSLLSLSLILVLLSFIVTFSGCSAALSYCNYTGGPPNVPYNITYSDLSIGTGRVNGDGTYRVLKHGPENCNQLRLRVRFGNNLGLALSASPSSVYLPSPPTSGTITGQSFDATYGMPKVEYFDSNGYLVGSVNATSVASNGTSLQANMPDLSYVYSGTYQVKVTNKTYDGYYLTIVGSATMTAWGRDRADSDADGWYDDEDCAPYDPAFNYNCSDTCGGSDNVPRYICNDQPL